jgi:hypothetical protein
MSQAARKLKTERRWAVTGTPIQASYLVCYWRVIWFVIGELFGLLLASYLVCYLGCERHAHPGELLGVLVGWGAQ